MYFNQEESSTDQMSFSSSSCCSKNDKNCRKGRIPKLCSVRRTGLRQLVLLVFVVILSSSLLTTTLAASLRQIRSLSPSSAERKMCEASSAERPTSGEVTKETIFTALITICNTTIQKANSLAKQWMEDELQMTLDRIHEVNGRKVQLPKDITKHTSINELKNKDAKKTLTFLDENLKLVLGECEKLARTNNGDKQTFDNLYTEMTQIIDELEVLMKIYFKAEPVPAKQEPDTVRHENSEDETRRRHYKWIIFHDYINLVEYTKDVMEYLENKFCNNSN